MTKQKTYEIVDAYLKCLKKQIALPFNGGCNGNCDECDLYDMRGAIGQRAEAMKIALESVKKRMPKKVVDIHLLENQFDKEVFGADAKFGRCPACWALVCTVWNIDSCGDCGQKLDWSDGE